MLSYGASDFFPAPLKVAITPVANSSIAIPIVFGKFLGQFSSPGFGVFRINYGIGILGIMKYDDNTYYAKQLCFRYILISD